MRLGIHLLAPFAGAVPLVILAIGLVSAEPDSRRPGLLLDFGFNLAKDRRRP